MIRTSVILHTDGAISRGPDTDESGSFTLEQLQGAVGGYIETVPVRAGRCLVIEGDGDDLSVESVANLCFRVNVIMICDEEGKLKKNPQYNQNASDLAQTPMVGEVLLVETEAM